MFASLVSLIEGAKTWLPVSSRISWTAKILITHTFKWKRDIKSTVGHWIQKRSVHMSTNPDQALGNKIGSSWGMA